MRIKRTVLGLLTALGVILGIQAAQIHAENDKNSGAKKSKSGEAAEKTFPFDNGPDTIDVSAYPAEQQVNYKFFVRKCSKCHTLARAINSPYALPEEWEAYVKKMQKKKRSGLDAKSAEKITAFLKFDSSIRKKDLIGQKLQEKDAK